MSCSSSCPKPGARSCRAARPAVVESVKAASEVYAPVSGEVTRSTTRSRRIPRRSTAIREGEGWFFKLQGWPITAEFAGLMDEAAYAEFVKRSVN